MADKNNNSWSADWDDAPEALKPVSPADQAIIDEAKKRFKICEDWEAQARLRFEYDYKFANGDTHNKYQWDSDLVAARELEDRPVLTINKTQQHNLMIINDAKQNKPGVRIRPVGDEASFEGAQVYQELVYHTEYISNAENVYDSATVWQVEAGWGYWRVVTDYVSDKSFDQELYIRRVKDPRSVYLDPDINEKDGSDARFGFVFDDTPKDLFNAKNPKFAGLTAGSNFGGTPDGWFTRNTIRVCEYYRKTQKKDKLVAFIDPGSKEQVIAYWSELNKEGRDIYRQVKDEDTSNERNVVKDNIEWFKIAGDRIIDRKPWLGKYIPIVRLPGTETVIDGTWDCKGHTRSLINAQQMYNYNTSANIEYGALQTKAPWLAPADAIEGYEEYYKTANSQNHSYLPYNHMDEDGNVIPPPSRPAAPQASPSYVEGMKIAQNEMMMASGQYQSQLGENENAKSGVAINARQRQGDRATYHFIDNQAIAIRFTGKILIDLYPKIYDTKRMRRISTRDGKIMNVTVDPQAKEAYQKQKSPETDNQQNIEEIIFNPNIGMYDIQSDTGPSYATKRIEAFTAMSQIAAQNKDFMHIAGDLLFQVADFPEADILAQRYRKIIPPNVTGDGLPPEVEETMHKASDQIEQLKAQVIELTRQVKDKDKELTIKAQNLDLNLKKETVVQAREDYKAETDRVVALGNAGPGISVEQIQPVLKQLLQGMIANGELSVAPGPHEGGTPMGVAGEKPAEEDLPEGAQLAQDGNYYVQKDGQWNRVELQ